MVEFLDDDHLRCSPPRPNPAWAEQDRLNRWARLREREAAACGRMKPKPMKDAEECPKGGKHEWGIDGMHSNEFCKKCWTPRPLVNV